ncbi:uncharacterized protein P884DRAFT_259212 [Thermothelomyces heterothallicus CBS 202.75]|uniref:uncharacterized protein n=1 Tax=Thermothelomyces heterothallicus CBS 202.75 TaxID=1149848 RepID=UPI00374366AA
MAFIFLFFRCLLFFPGIPPWITPVHHGSSLALGGLLLTPVWLDLQGWWGGQGAKQGRHGSTKQRLTFHDTP